MNYFSEFSIQKGSVLWAALSHHYNGVFVRSCIRLKIYRKRVHKKVQVPQKIAACDATLHHSISRLSSN